MDKQARTREIIIQLKTIKEDKDLTNQDILDLVEASGGVTSMTTIRRVFAEGSENQSFSYRNTIQPISHAMLAISEQEKVSDLDENVLQAQLDALKQVVELKDTLISELQRDLDAEQRKVAHLLTEVERYGKMLDKLMGA